MTYDTDKVIFLSFNFFFNGNVLYNTVYSNRFVLLVKIYLSFYPYPMYRSVFMNYPAFIFQAAGLISFFISLTTYFLILRVKSSDIAVAIVILLHTKNSSHS